MFLTLLARLAMIASILYYAISLCLLWYYGFADPALFMEDFLGVTNSVPVHIFGQLL